MAKRERRLWALLAMFTVTVACGLGYLYVHVQHSVPVPVPPGLMLHRAPAQHLSEGGGENFSDAMARLNTAFQARSGGDVEKAVAAVNASSGSYDARPCPFEWRNGEAALLLQTDSGGRLALTKTINTCADSIERLP